jgi:hypothetical protein
MNGIGTEKNLTDLKFALSDPTDLFVGHTREAESFVDVNENLVEAAEKLGYRQDAIQTIADGYGRNIFTIYRFR